MTITTVETSINRKFTIQTGGWGADVAVHDTLSNVRVFSVLSPEQSKEIANALLGQDATVITDLPEAKDDGFGYVKAGHYDRSANTDAETVLKNAKALLAIHKFLVEKKAKEAEAEAERVKAEAAAKVAERDKRREELIVEFRSCSWANLTRPAREAFDRIIDLELEAAQA